MNYKRMFIPNGIIFLTIVTHNRNKILIDNIEILQQSLINTLRLYRYKIIAYVIQPDHIHCLIQPKCILDYPNIVKSFKYSFTKNVGLVKPTYNKIWQNRYWEHTIKDEEDLHKHLNYIHYNPVKHGYTNNVASWQYSTFNKFVKKGFYELDWGTSKDISNIKDMDFE